MLLYCVFFSCSFSSSAEHHNSTDLTLVGLQVWRGALLLADYILHNQQQFIGKNVVELGSGVGLTGVAAAMYAKHVTCTGKSEDFRENKSFSLLFIFPIVRHRCWRNPKTHSIEYRSKRTFDSSQYGCFGAGFYESQLVGESAKMYR